MSDAMAAMNGATAPNGRETSSSARRNNASACAAIGGQTSPGHPSQAKDFDTGGTSRSWPKRLNPQFQRG